MSTRESEINVGRAVLQAIFAIFLGLMITAVVGVGVYTFHPNPADATQEQLEELYQERTQIECPGSEPCKPLTELPADQQQQLAELDQQIKTLQDQTSEQREAWGQSTSITLIAIATVLMVVSLLLGESLTVLSNGILLGGLFTMLYGVGWGLAAGNSLTRFLVLVAALLVSLVLGYLTFVRKRDRRTAPPVDAAAAQPAAEGQATDDPGALTDLAARVAELERRLSGVAAALGAEPSRPDPTDQPAT